MGCIVLNFLFSCGNTEDKNLPKNIILMISDGCGFNQVDATSIYQFGKSGEQIYEKFPVKYAMSTYPAGGTVYDPDAAWKSFQYVLNKPTDSAASATAMATGIKTYNKYIAVDTSNNKIKTILERAEELGKSTGIVTSVLFSHATPACFVAHNISRANYDSIAREMIVDSHLEVLMGCGHPYFDDNGNRTSDTTFNFVGGKNTWEALEAGQIGNDADGDAIIDFWKLIQERLDFQTLMSGDTPKRVIGIPKVRATLQQSRAGNVNAALYEVPLIQDVPTLPEMALAAINVLDNDEDGFFLMIEGGAIDWASHGNQPGRMIEEEIDFNKTIEAVVEWVEKNSSWAKTLVIVTGDHETGYLTGPGSGNDKDLASGGIFAVWKPLVNNGKGKLPGMEWHTHGHTNSLIPLYSKGRGSELFNGFADKIDPVRGKYVDNTEVGKLMFKLWGE